MKMHDSETMRRLNQQIEVDAQAAKTKAVSLIVSATGITQIEVDAQAAKTKAVSLIVSATGITQLAAEQAVTALIHEGMLSIKYTEPRFNSRGELIVR